MTEPDIRKTLGSRLAYIANAFHVLKAQKTIVRTDLANRNYFQIQIAQVIFEFTQLERPDHLMVRVIKNDVELCLYKSSGVISEFVHPELVRNHLTILLRSTESLVSEVMKIENDTILS